MLVTAFVAAQETSDVPDAKQRWHTKSGSKKMSSMDRLEVGTKVRVKVPEGQKSTKYSDRVGGNIHVDLKPEVNGIIHFTHVDFDRPFVKATPGVMAFYTIKVPYYEHENCIMYTYVLIDPEDIVEVL